MHHETPFLPKVTVGCRMSPDLREELETEAPDADMTLSSYIEYILTFRVRDRSIYDKYLTLIDDYNELVDEYNELIENWESDEPEVEEETILPWLTPAAEERAEVLLQILRNAYPDYKREQLLVSALEVAVLNSKNNFFIYTLEDYFARPKMVENLPA